MFSSTIERTDYCLECEKLFTWLEINLVEIDNRQYGFCRFSCKLKYYRKNKLSLIHDLPPEINDVKNLFEKRKINRENRQLHKKPPKLDLFGFPKA
jgi:hypothetical protein